MDRLAYVEKEKNDLVKDIHRLANLGVGILFFEDGWVIIHEVDKSFLWDKVMKKRASDPILIQIKKDVVQKMIFAFEIGEDGFKVGFVPQTLMYYVREFWYRPMFIGMLFISVPLKCIMI